MNHQKKWTLPLLGCTIAALVSCQGNSHTTQSLLPTNYTDDYSAVVPVSQRDKWGAANVHDPSVIATDSFYYAYSTDAIYIPHGTNINPEEVPTGHIQIRKSKDLVNWQFVGWALPSIPADAVTHIHSYTNGKGADGIWAPYILQYGNIYRLYYSVSSFGTNSSYIGLAIAQSPEGPWEDVGCVVKTNPESAMNAIDPSIVTTPEGRQWMHYGSYFGGLYCVELDVTSGFTKTQGDLGQMVATRAEKKDKIIEAPEIIYNPELKKYFLFVSYDPLFTHYNLRVGRSDSPNGPFYDMFGNNMADTTNNYPILTHSYKFKGHPGWSGNAHCSVINDNGKYYLFHQGRLAPDNLMMVMHTREIHWLPNGWPTISPERYAGVPSRTITKEDIAGEWEVIELKELNDNVKLWQGQIPPGGWTYGDKEFNLSQTVVFSTNLSTSHPTLGQWKLQDDILTLNNTPCKVFAGWDWENNRTTVLFSGIMENGSSIWGKKVNLTDN